MHYEKPLSPLKPADQSGLSDGYSINFYGAALLHEDGTETPITEAMVSAALDALHTEHTGDQHSMDR